MYILIITHSYICNKIINFLFNYLLGSQPLAGYGVVIRNKIAHKFQTSHKAMIEINLLMTHVCHIVWFTSNLQTK
jgi:hypothetical protein